MSLASVRVETADGLLDGRRETGIDVFLGIPYAAPPIGARRFRPPASLEAWSGVRDAREFGHAAPQIELPGGVLPALSPGPQSEDCLHLNVFTPRAERGKRPVMVWFHGGAFTIGSGGQAIYDGRHLARRGDVVVVTCNYRLGALGFLDLEARFGEDFAGSANLGLADQIAALRWVRTNIERFGGDPGRVTVFGESAGAMSVSSLLASPAADGLFRRAIPQSGTAGHLLDRESAARVVDRFLRELGHDDPAALRELPVDAILAAQQRCDLHVGEYDALLAFQPTVGVGVLPRHPLDALHTGVELLTGTTSDEWRLFQFLNPKLRNLDAKGLEERVERRVGAERAAALLESYRAEAPDAEPSELFCRLETDRVFRVPMLRLAAAHSAGGGAVRVYEFAWKSPAARGRLGACHAIEIPFVFGTLDARGMARFSGSGPEAEALRDRVMDAWLGFARDGDPRHPELPDWPLHDPATRPTLVFDRKCRVDLAPRDVTFRAWDGLLQGRPGSSG